MGAWEGKCRARGDTEDTGFAEGGVGSGVVRWIQTHPTHTLAHAESLSHRHAH